MALHEGFDVHRLVINFASDNKHVAELGFINDDPAGISITEICGNGLVNYIYRVAPKNGQTSIILKYGEEHVKALPEQSVSLERQVMEYKSLVLVHSIQPGSVPEPYCMDKNHKIIAMRDMIGWELLADQLESGVVDQVAAVHLGHLLAKIHNETSKAEVSAERWQQLCDTFRGHSMKDICCTFLLEDSIDETAVTNKISEEMLVFFCRYRQELEKQSCIVKAKDLFNEEICFTHSDLHWKSIFVKEGRAVLFDLEFGSLGHPALDVAYVVISYYIYHLITKRQPHRNEEAKQVLQRHFQLAIQQFVLTYLGDISKSSPGQKSELYPEIALFAGVVLWTCAVFKGFEMFTSATQVERLQMLHTGFRMMTSHGSLTSVDQIIETLFTV